MMFDAYTIDVATRFGGYRDRAPVLIMVRQLDAIERAHSLVMARAARGDRRRLSLVRSRHGQRTPWRWVAVIVARMFAGSVVARGLSVRAGRRIAVPGVGVRDAMSARMVTGPPRLLAPGVARMT